MKYKIKKIQILMRKIKKIYKQEGFEHSYAFNDIAKGFKLSQKTTDIQILSENQFQTCLKQKLKLNSNRYLISVMHNLSHIYKSIQQNFSQHSSEQQQFELNSLQIGCKLQETSESLSIQLNSYQHNNSCNGEQKKYLQIKKYNQNVRLKQLKQEESKKIKNGKQMKEFRKYEKKRKFKDYIKQKELDVRKLSKAVRSDRYE